MHDLVVLSLLAIVVAVLLARALATRTGIPAAVPLVLLGAAASFVPVLQGLHISPELVLTIFLPPLVYRAAFFTAPREARADAVPISALAIGLTLATTAAAASAVYFFFTEIGWPAAFAFGAAVAPTDAVAATAVLQRLGAPRRIVTILEGESLINDGVALTVFALAVEAMSHTLTLGEGLGRLALVVIGGIGYGLIVGVVIGKVQRHAREPGLQLLLSVITPFVAYLPAETLDFSGILATVVAGFYLGVRTEGMLPASVRLTGNTFWQVLVLLLESALFVLLGLQIVDVIEAVSGYSTGRLAAAAVLVIAVVIGLRLLWELVISPLMRYLPPRPLDFAHIPWRERVVIGWGGMRGAISLAIALSLPISVDGRSVAERSVLIFLAAAVVLATLIGQSATLPTLLRALGLGAGDTGELELTRARQSAMEAAMDRLNELEAADRLDASTAEVFRQLIQLRLDRVRSVLEAADDPDPDAEPDRPGTGWVRREMIRAQRERTRLLYRKGKIGVETFRAIQHELDLEEPHRLPGTP
ncbi:MAG: Na+/H+ antiporter [Streptosporangiales bacterium]|nr:Na+/H+ antiporter [Streptosporangiales bacterium]